MSRRAAEPIRSYDVWVFATHDGMAVDARGRFATEELVRRWGELFTGRSDDYRIQIRPSTAFPSADPTAYRLLAPTIRY